MIATGFKDRTEAGRSLARLLERFAGRKDVVVLGLPRGGMPVAYEIAKALGAPLDAFVVGKLGFPGMPELAIGAVAGGGVTVYNPGVLDQSGLTEGDLRGIALKKRAELERKEALYRQGGPPIPVERRIIILADDGAATGASMRVGLKALRRLNPKSIVAAVPVASPEGLKALREEADEAICLQVPESFSSVGQWYEDFRQVSDEEVMRCLESAKDWSAAARSESRGRPAPKEEPVSLWIQAGGVALPADLTLPANEAGGLVLFAHGSGSSRQSPRNRQVARSLNRSGLATLLMDLLTREEEEADMATAEYRFDIGLLAERLMGATRWARADSRLSGLKLGYFGASTGAAAALVAASRLPGEVGAVVSRGGRPDLAAEALRDVSAPTLLIVGGEDETVLDLNRHAMESLHCEKRLAIIPGATHLFEEPGALEEVARLAVDWFGKRLPDRDRKAPEDVPSRA